MKRRLLNPIGPIEEASQTTADTFEMLTLKKEAELLEGPEGTTFIEE